MSLFSSSKRGNLDGVKAALSRGEMEALSCGEKLKCVNAALQTKRNGALMEALIIPDICHFFYTGKIFGE